MGKELRYDFTGDDKSLGKTLGNLGDKAEDAGDSMRQLAADAKRLDQQMAASQARVRSLIQELANTERGSEKFKELTKAVNGASRELAQVTRWRKALGDAGDEGAKGFAAAFNARIGPLMARAPLSPPLLAAVAVAAPGIAALVSGAVTAGVAGGAVVTGVVLAGRDPRVRAAGAELGKAMLGDLEDDAKVFVDPLLQSITMVRREFSGVRGDIRRTFGDAARYVEPLTRGLTGLVREALPGIAAAVAKAGPVIDALGDELPDLGRTVGDALETIAGGSEEAAEAIRATSQALALLTSTTAGTVRWLTELYGLYERIGEIPGIGILTSNMALTADRVETTLHRAAPAVDDAGAAARRAAHSFQALADAQQEAVDAATSQFNAITRLEEAIDESTSSTYKNNAGINANTRQGQRNRDMLEGLAARTRAASADTLKLTRSSAQAEGVMSRGYTAFVRAAMGMGMSRQAAHRLAVQLHLIPPVKNVKVNVNTRDGLSKVEYLRQRLASIRDRSVRVAVRFTSSGLHVPGGTIQERAAGGPVYAGHVYKTGERGTELFIPNQDGTIIPADQTRRILSGAGPGAAGGLGGGWPAWLSTPGRFEDAMERAFTRAIGRWQPAGRSNPAVMADLYARGG